jgi:L-alanine-DL-glutamate epimerase-like enolase superfamily enzyme
VKVTALETILVEEFPNLCYVRVHTDEGLVGLGETFFAAQAVSAWVHEVASAYLLGKDALRIDRHWQGLNPFVGFDASAVENRGRSAIDIALWDLLGKTTGQPIYQLLGGAFRDRIRTYNTCAGYRYVRKVPETAGLPVSNWNVENAAESAEGPYEDLGWFLSDAGSLAQSLLEQGITGMKIWPLDPYAEATNGQSISNEDLRAGIEPFRKVREAVGDRMELMVELHSLWNLPAAIKIARALEEYEPTWFEDPIKMDNVDALARFAASTRVPTAASETLATRWSFRELFERAGIGVCIFDPAWVGGISEAKKVASMAEAWQLPVAPHDCSGPVEFAAAVHVSTNAPNALVQESVRAYYTGWYRELVTEVPRVEDGWIYPLTGPGLGTELLPEVAARADATVRFSRVS